MILNVSRTGDSQKGHIFSQKKLKIWEQIFDKS